MTNRTLFDVLGTKYDPEINTEENLKAAGMANWNIRSVPVYAVMSDRDVPMGRYATLRTRPGDRSKRDVLGETKEKYSAVDNATNLEFMGELADSLNRQVNKVTWGLGHLGATPDGKKVFFTLESGWAGTEGIVLVLLDSHDGTLARQLRVGYVDPRTGGLLNVPLGGGSTGVVKLTSNGAPVPVTSSQVMEEVGRYERDRLDLIHWYEPLHSRDEARKLVTQALGDPGNAKSTVTRRSNQVDEVLSFLGGQEERGVNRWDLLMAVCGWSDFSAPVRGAKLGGLQPKRAEKSLYFPNRKQRALETLFGGQE